MTEMPNWRTSSFTRGDSCVEVADNNPSTVFVRDTKNRDYGKMDVDPSAWSEFVEFSKKQTV